MINIYINIYGLIYLGIVEIYWIVIFINLWLRDLFVLFCNNNTVCMYGGVCMAKNRYRINFAYVYEFDLHHSYIKIVMLVFDFIILWLKYQEWVTWNYIFKSKSYGILWKN